MQITYFLIARKKISILTMRIMWLCTGNFLTRARDCKVWINYFRPIAVRDFLKFMINLGVKLVLTNIIF